jgi:hypothetical protein
MAVVATVSALVLGLLPAESADQLVDQSVVSVMVFAFHRRRKRIPWPCVPVAARCL